VTSSVGGDVTADHVTSADDVRAEDFRRSTADSQSQQTVMTSLAGVPSRHVTTSNSSLSFPVSRLPFSSSSSSSILRAASASQDDLAATLRQQNQGHDVKSRTQRSAGGRALADSRSVQDLEAMLNQVETSERQAWNWLETLDTENSQRLGDLRHYIATMTSLTYVTTRGVTYRGGVTSWSYLRHYIASLEQSKRQTSEAIAQLLQIECDLRQQLNRRQHAVITGTNNVGGPSLTNTDHRDDVILDEVSRSLRDIVGRLQTQQHGSSISHAADGGLNSAWSRYSASTAATSPATARLSGVRNQLNGRAEAGIDSDEGYDANSNSLRSEFSVRTPLAERPPTGQQTTTHVAAPGRDVMLNPQPGDVML